MTLNFHLKHLHVSRHMNVDFFPRKKQKEQKVFIYIDLEAKFDTKTWNVNNLPTFLSCGYLSVLVSYSILQFSDRGSHSSKIDDPLRVIQIPYSLYTIARMWSYGFTETLKLSIPSSVLKYIKLSNIQCKFTIHHSKDPMASSSHPVYLIKDLNFSAFFSDSKILKFVNNSDILSEVKGKCRRPNIIKVCFNRHDVYI